MIGEKDKIHALREAWLQLLTDIKETALDYKNKQIKLDKDLDQLSSIDVKVLIHQSLTKMQTYIVTLIDNYNNLLTKYIHKKFKLITIKDIKLVDHMTIFLLYKNFNELVNDRYKNIFEDDYNDEITYCLEQILANINFRLETDHDLDISEFEFDLILNDIQAKYDLKVANNKNEEENKKQAHAEQEAQILSSINEVVNNLNTYYLSQTLGNLLNKNASSYLPYTKTLHLGNLKLENKTTEDKFENVVQTLIKEPFEYDLTDEHANILIDWDGDKSTETLYDFIEYLSLKILLSFPVKQSQIDFVSGKYDDKYTIKIGLLSDFNQQIKTIDRVEQLRSYSREIIDLTAQRTRDFAQLQRDGYPMNIWTYNEQNQHDKKNAHFVVVHDFPNHLLGDMYNYIQEFNVANRYGIYTVLIFNRKTDEAARGMTIKDIEKTFKSNYKVTINKDKLSINGVPYTFDLNEGDFSLRKLHDHIHKASTVNKAEVAHLSKLLEDTNNYDKDSNLELILGQSGQDRVYLKITETEPHAIITGKTGTGKSVLLHNLILGGAYKYSPDQLNFYLFDLKGSEFTTIYRDLKLPHIKFMITHKPSESDVYQSLSSVIDEKNRRNDLFNQYRVTSIVEYNKLVQSKPELNLEVLPRVMLIIDEFVTMYHYDTKYFDGIQKILLELATQGRSYGISMILSTQNLPNQYQFNNILNNIIYRINLDNAPNVVHSLSGLNITSQEYKHLSLLPGNAVLTKGMSEHKMFRGAFETGDVLKEIATEVIHKYKNYPQDMVVSGSYDTQIYHDKFITYPTKDIEDNKEKDKAFMTLGKSGITGQPVINTFSPNDPVLLMVGNRFEHKNIETIAILSLLENKDFKKDDAHITYLDFRVNHTPHHGMNTLSNHKDILFIQGKKASVEHLENLIEEAKRRIHILTTGTGSMLPVPKVVFLNGCDEVFNEVPEQNANTTSLLSQLRDQQVGQQNLISELISLAKQSRIYLVISVDDYRVITHQNFAQVDLKNILFTNPETIRDMSNNNKSAIHFPPDILKQATSKESANFYVSRLNEVIKLIKVSFNQDF